MTRFLALAPFVLAAVLACATPQREDAARKIHSSAMGFRIAIPSDWTLVDRELLALLGDPTQSEAFEKVDPAVIAQVRSSIESGDMEFLLLATGTETFRDNVNLLRAPGTLPPSQSAVPMACAVTARQLSDVLRTPISFRRCDFVRVGENRAFFLDWITPNQTTRTLQYHFTLTPSTILSVTGAFTEETAEASGERLRELLESLELETSAQP